MTKEALEIMTHIFDARIANALSPEEWVAWTSARGVLDFALNDNLDALREYDYLEIEEG